MKQQIGRLRGPKPVLENFSGMRQGKLLVLYELHISRRKRSFVRYVVCQCNCGKVKSIKKYGFRAQQTQSCGCLAIERMTQAVTTHGQCKTKTYRAWSSMKERCYSIGAVSYPNYGGRGIVVCDRWHLFDNFLADMGAPPEGMSLDRIDNDGNYEPGNCRWATRTEQNNNKRNCWRLTVDGQTLSVNSASLMYGVLPKTIRYRLSAGWSHEDACKRPPKQAPL